MPIPPIYADFQNLDDANRLRLTCRGTLDDLSRYGVELRDGLRLTFWTDDADDRGEPDDLRADGTVQYDPASQCWVAAMAWQTLRHASDEGRRPIGPDAGTTPSPDEGRIAHRP
jgi:hypothetical protein